MSENDPNTAGSGLPQAEVKSHGRRGGISAMWIVPLVAALVGAGIAYRAWSERGPIVEIVFPTAEGLEAGKTTVQFRDVVIGNVSAIDVNPDLQSVTVTAKMVKESTPGITDGAKFWVVKPEIGGGHISGLGTIVSGSYISAMPGPKDGKPLRKFVGLTEAPLNPEGRGLEIDLKAPRLHGLSAGAPIYYLDVRVGEITGHDFDADGKGVVIHGFVDDEYAGYVHDNTRFWNVSGLDVTASLSQGFELDLESISSLLAGGVNFDTPGKPGKPAVDGATFTLQRHGPATAAGASKFLGPRFVVEAPSVGSLKHGDPIYYRQEQVGQVVSQALHDDADSVGIQIEVASHYAPLIRTNTIFWNSSGISADLGLTGLHVHTESLESLMEGGIAFAIPSQAGPPAAEGSVFKLHDKAPKDWQKWTPQLSLSGAKSAEGEGAKEEPVLVHHKADEAGESTSKHWYRKLF